MAEKTDIKKENGYLGIDSERLGQTRGPKSGRRVLVQERNPSTDVRGGKIKETKYLEQDFRSNASSSLWKEYLLDKKHITGVLLNNNVLIWFPWDKELTGSEPKGIAREKYPDSKVDATFLFGERGLGMSNYDLVVNSETESFDSHLNTLVDYFGRSLDWQERVRLSTSYQSKDKQAFEGSLQEYLMKY